MTNRFKTNTRFAALNDDNLEKNNKNIKKMQNNYKGNEKMNKFNSFKRNNKFNEREYYSERERRAEENAKRELEEINKQKALTPDNFPELVFNKNQSIKNPQKTDYLEKIKKVNHGKNKNNDLDLDLKNLLPGWVLIRKDKHTNKIIKNSKASNVKIQEILKEKNIAESVINSLVELHERRTQEYIELNGYDAWEKMFKSPNWREREAETDDEDSDDEESDVEEDYM